MEPSPLRVLSFGPGAEPGHSQTQSSSAGTTAGMIEVVESEKAATLRPLRVDPCSHSSASEEVSRSLPDDLVGQVALLAEVVQYQALKIDKLEATLSQLQRILPPWEEIQEPKDVLDGFVQEVGVGGKGTVAVSGGNDREMGSLASGLDEAAAGGKDSGSGEGGMEPARKKRKGQLGDRKAEDRKLVNQMLRKQSIYQAFMSFEIARIKEGTPGIVQQDAFAAAAQNWQEHPDNPKKGKPPRASPSRT